MSDTEDVPGVWGARMIQMISVYEQLKAGEIDSDELWSPDQDE